MLIYSDCIISYFVNKSSAQCSLEWISTQLLNCNAPGCTLLCLCLACCSDVSTVDLIVLGLACYIFQVQSFFRGWLCRRRWKQIVDEYIRSEHAESMRKRNSIVFGMVECEEEYVKQLSTLVTVFLRPLKMAASSKKPTITHEDVNSIFLNRSGSFYWCLIVASLGLLTANFMTWKQHFLCDSTERLS